MIRNTLLTVRWGWAAAGVLVTEAIMIAAAFAWVAIYSLLLNPGRSPAFYQGYAMSASPFVCLLLGGPVFYAVCRWIGRRRPSSAVATAMGLFCVYCLIEVPMMFAGDNPSMTAWFEAVNFSTKFLACYWGGLSAVRLGAATPA